MRAQTVLGGIMLLLGLFLLYELRGPLFQFVLIVLEAIGIFLALVLIAVGLALIFWRRKALWYRVEETGTTTQARAFRRKALLHF